MIRKNFAFATVAAALLASGTAFAAQTQPAAGEAPFAEAVVATSQVQRAQVAADAAAHAPLAGNLPVTQPVVASELSRAQVREITREAAIRGEHPVSGELS